MDPQFEELAQQLIVAGNQLAADGMVPATSGNFSARCANGDLAITASGVHKGRMTLGDIMRTSENGESLDQRKPSAETLLHVQIYRQYPEINAAIHVHSVNATVLSQMLQDSVNLSNYELLKAFPGIDTHETEVTIPIFANDQQIPRLASAVDQYIKTHGDIVAYLIAGHGFYAWGKTVEQALNCVEALEFLFSCELLKRRIS
jgi:methylthioribulose-1-phosphate dehydratase